MVDHGWYLEVKRYEMAVKQNNSKVCGKKICCIVVAVLMLSHIRLFGTPWTVACQVPLSMGFHRQEYWNRLLLYVSPMLYHYLMNI